MRTKDYLNQIRKLDMMIGHRITELNHMRERLSILTGIDYTKDRIQSTPSSGNIEVEEMVDFENEILKMIEEETKLKNRIIAEIQILDNALFVDILVRRYVECLSFERIACDMGYSYNYVLNIHGRALKDFREKVVRKC